MCQWPLAGPQQRVFRRFMLRELGEANSLHQLPVFKRARTNGLIAVNETVGFCRQSCGPRSRIQRLRPFVRLRDAKMSLR